MKYASLLILIFLFGCEACSKNFRISGLVTDPNGDPVANAEIRFIEVFSETDEQGRYEIEKSSLGGVVGFKVFANKEGYLESSSEELADNEANIDICGDVNLIRDIEMELE